jgi:4-alpha-glucanotransferase
MSPELARLAAAHGVATDYRNQLDQPVEVRAESVVAVLAALGVDASTDAAVRAALAEAKQRPALPPVVVLREGESRTVPGTAATARLVAEDGGARELPVASGRVELGPSLPVGWYRLITGDVEIAVAVAPRRLPLPARRQWGLTVQLYATRSQASWGLGDLHDLTELVRWTGRQGGDGVLVNPLHAAAPVTPVQNSPYYPASRRWTNPLYLRIEDTDGYRSAAPALRMEIDALRVPSEGDLIDRDAIWTAKSAALALLYRDAPPVDVERLDPALRDWATWCALTEVHGTDWRQWPEQLRRPDSPAIAAARREHAARVGFHAWLQQLCLAQLANVQEHARAGGLGIGVVHDLAVGTDPAGADAWLLQDALALGARIGAPPDTFNQQGQDWGMPPWHPRRLAELGYAPLRDMLRGLLSHAGGVRIDHVLGLFRMWWVPADGTPRDGAYVSYDANALLGVVALEAHRAGAVVIGEDLGTVTPVVRRELAERGVLGSSVLWFEREDPVDGQPGRLRPLDEWRAGAAASVTTHDLPTALGWLRGEHVRVRAELGLLNDPATEEKKWLRERDELVALLRANDLLDDDSDDDALVLALHAAVAMTPSRLVLAGPADAVGDLRQPNLPGTVDEYPSWRLPVADRDGRLLLLEQLLDDPRLHRLAAMLRERVR